MGGRWERGEAPDEGLQRNKKGMQGTAHAVFAGHNQLLLEPAHQKVCEVVAMISELMISAPELSYVWKWWLPYWHVWFMTLKYE